MFIYAHTVRAGALTTVSLNSICSAQTAAGASSRVQNIQLLIQFISLNLLQHRTSTIQFLADSAKQFLSLKIWR